MRGIPVSEKYRGIEGDDGIVYRGRRGFTTTTTTPQPFYGRFSGTTRVSWCQKRTSGLYGSRED